MSTGNSLIDDYPNYYAQRQRDRDRDDGDYQHDIRRESAVADFAEMVISGQVVIAGDECCVRCREHLGPCGSESGLCESCEIDCRCDCGELVIDSADKPVVCETCQSLGETKQYYVEALNRKVLAVAVVDSFGWSAFVGSVVGSDHGKEMWDVVSHGTRLRKHIAVAIFGFDGGGYRL